MKIRGTRPLLWHHFGPDAIPLEKGEKTGVAGNDPEEWKKTYTALPDGRLFVDASYIFATIRNGSKHTKKGRGSIQGSVVATLQVLDDVALVDRYLPDGNGHGEMTTDRTQPVYLDVRGVRNPSTKGSNVRYRVAASTGWESEFRIMWDKTLVSRGEMQASVIDAGRYYGIGDGRNIGFGRFEVADFNVSDA